MFQRFCCGNFSNPAVGQGDWQNFQFEVAFDAPPVVVILSTGFQVPQNVQVRSVTSTGFEALLEVPPGCTGGLPPVTALRLAFGMAGEVYCCGEKKPVPLWVITYNKVTLQAHHFVDKIRFYGNLYLSCWDGCGFVTLKWCFVVLGIAFIACSWI